MKRFISLIGFSFLLPFISLNSFAGSGWSGNSTVTGLYLLNETTALVKLETSGNPGGCNTDSNGDAYVNPETQKVWYTALLTAYVSGKTVNLYLLPTCHDQWSSSYSDIGHVRLK